MADAIGAGVALGAALYTAASGFVARHENTHSSQVTEIRRLISDFEAAAERGEVTEEDWKVYRAIRAEARQKESEYEESIEVYKETPTLRFITKWNNRRQVRQRKKALRRANRSLRRHYYDSTSDASDASSVNAASGSPPRSPRIYSDEEDRRILSWAEDVANSDSDGEGAYSPLSTGSRHSLPPPNPPPLPLEVPVERWHPRGKLRRGSPADGPSQPLPPIPAPSRSRSASQRAAYAPKPVLGLPLMPVLNAVDRWGRGRSNTSAMGNNDRGSGSSDSIGRGSSDYSPNRSSPATPFESSESSLDEVGIRTSRSRHVGPVSAGMTQRIPQVHGPFVKVKVHFHEDIFMMQVAMSTEYEVLVQRVEKKIRLCGLPRKDDGPLRVKYRDEDGDLVTLGSTEDVQMAFQEYRPGGQVTLFVT